MVQAATAVYRIVDDNLSFMKKRNYARLRFQKPAVTVKPQVFVSFKEGQITAGDSMLPFKIESRSKFYNRKLYQLILNEKIEEFELHGVEIN